MKIKTLAADLMTAAMAAGTLTGAVTVSAEETQDVTLWYYWETEGHQVALNEMIDKYNASQDAYAVTAKYVPFADFKKQLSIGASANELPDLVILDSPDHASYASMGIFADITDKMDAHILKGRLLPRHWMAFCTAYRLDVIVFLFSITKICLKKPGSQRFRQHGMSFRRQPKSLRTTA